MKRMRICCNNRQKLPDSAFAYVDDTGKRLLPIYDKLHLRAAIMAIGRWKKEDPVKWLAMQKIIRQASKFGIKIPSTERYIEPWSVS